MYLDKSIYYMGLNEVLTEWIAYTITGTKENNYLAQYFSFIETIGEKSLITQSNIIKAYFYSDKEKIYNEISNIYPSDAKERINKLTVDIYALHTS